MTVHNFRYRQVLDAELLVGRAASQSNVASLPPAEREVLLDGVRELVRSHPDLVGRDSIELPYDTEVAICHLR